MSQKKCGWLYFAHSMYEIIRKYWNEIQDTINICILNLKPYKIMMDGINPYKLIFFTRSATM